MTKPGYKSNFKKAQKVVEEQKKIKRTHGLPSDEKKAGLEMTMRNINDAAKQEGLNDNS